MVAAVFRAHGLFCGDCVTPFEDYPEGTVENMAIKKLIRDTVGRNFLDPPQAFPQMRDKFERILRAQGYDGGPWMAKIGAQNYRAFDSLEPFYVHVVRPLDDILASYSRSHFMQEYGPEKIRFAVERNLDLMKSIHGAMVRAHHVAGGDFTSLEAAFRHCGLKFDPEKAKSVIYVQHRGAKT